MIAIGFDQSQVAKSLHEDADPRPRRAHHHRVIDVGLMMLVMMQMHSLLIDMSLKRNIRIIERGKGYRDSSSKHFDREKGVSIK
jgi:hypothetical protein